MAAPSTYVKRMERDLPDQYHHKRWEREQGFRRRDAVEQRTRCRANYKNRLTKDYYRAYRAEHPEYVEAMRESNKRWREKHKDVVAGYNAKHSARRKAERLQKRLESWKAVQAICKLGKELHALQRKLVMVINTETREASIATASVE